MEFLILMKYKSQNLKYLWEARQHKQKSKQNKNDSIEYLFKAALFQ